MSEAALLHHKAHACRLLIHVAGDEVIAGLLRERADEYEKMAVALKRSGKPPAPKAVGQRPEHRRASVGR